MRRYLLFGFLILLFVVPTSCAKKELTKEEARALLSKNPPAKVLRSIPKNLQIKHIDGRGKESRMNEEEKGILDKLQAAGYVTIREKPISSGKEREIFYETAATPKLSPFITADGADFMTVKVADLVVNEITSVVTKNQEADAGYTTRLVLTPVGESFPTISNPSPGPNHVTFQLSRGKWK